MSSNAPGTGTAPSAPSGHGISRPFLGLPLWAWGAGLAAFGIAAFIYFRQSSSGSSAAAMPITSTAGNGVPVPFPPTTTTSTPIGLGTVTLRPRNQSGWDWPTGLPVFSSKDGGVGPGNIAIYSPFDSTLPVTGMPVQGGSIAGQTTYYPVALPGGGSGFISAADIGSFSSSGSGGGPHGHQFGAQALHSAMSRQPSVAQPQMVQQGTWPTLNGSYRPVNGTQINSTFMPAAV